MELKSRKEQTGEMLERLREIERREEARERRERRNNIILKGEELPCGGTPKANVEQVLVQHLQVKAEIEEAFWIGRGKRGSALIAKLKSWQQKKEVMMNKNKLKNKKIYINNDLTKKKERRIQREIAEVAKVEREGGAKVKIGYQKLKVNDRIVRWKEEGATEEVKFWKG